MRRLVWEPQELIFAFFVGFVDLWLLQLLTFWVHWCSSQHSVRWIRWVSSFQQLESCQARMEMTEVNPKNKFKTECWKTNENWTYFKPFNTSFTRGDNIFGKHCTCCTIWQHRFTVSLNNAACQKVLFITVFGIFAIDIAGEKWPHQTLSSECKNSEEKKP